MANTLLTTNQITREAMRHLENNLAITKAANMQYDSAFAKEGGKIGDTLRIRTPQRHLVVNGPNLGTADAVESNVTLKIDSQFHVPMPVFSSQELTLSLDDFSKRYLATAASQLAASVDAEVFNRCYWAIGNSVGTPGTTPATSTPLLLAGQRLNEMGVPLNDRALLIDPAANTGLVQGLQNLFNPASIVDSQFKTGMVASNVLGFSDVVMTQSLGTHLTGTRASSGTVSAAVTTQGQSTITLAGLGASNTIRRGDVFTVAGCFRANPQTRVSTGSLHQFAVLADTTANGSGVATVTVEPIFNASSAYATVTVFPAASAVVTFIGAPNTAYPQSLVLQKDAIAFGSADLVKPSGVDMCSVQATDGFSMRFLRDYTIATDSLAARLDILFGSATIRSTHAVRVWG